MKLAQIRVMYILHEFTHLYHMTPCPYYKYRLGCGRLWLNVTIVTCFRMALSSLGERQRLLLLLALLHTIPRYTIGLKIKNSSID